MSVAAALIQYAASGGQDVSPVIEALADSRKAAMAAPRRAPRELDRPHARDYEHGVGTALAGGYKGKTYVLPTSWKGTHTTSGLGWGAGTAQDIMLAAGTPVGAPEAGVVEYFHPNGAQGGGSMMFDPVAPGPEYWLGHLDAGVAAGTRVKRGGYIARVSSRHPRPHVHEDRQYR